MTIACVRLALSTAFLFADALCSGPLQARTANIVLSVTGDDAMGTDLKRLVETFEKEQSLRGDSLSLLQGAQAVLAMAKSAPASTAGRSPTPPHWKPSKRSRMPRRSRSR